ncbi:class I SAM-dependent methyltransferase [Nocardioides caricicola]|uniref:Class I SAM-dependent methyltransferase n=1 Tax=Nocardioides caricicola TaxID=634770 RepID=A0ABW0N3U3_9ACTN
MTVARPVWVRSADDNGFSVVTVTDRPVDVRIDGRRVWTFWTHRDTVPAAFPLDRGPWPIRTAPWPAPLRRHLDGRARISVVDSATGATYFDRDVALGGGEGEIRVRNKKGVDLGIDKSGRLVPTFAGRSDRDISALLDATESVLAALRSAGVEPFVAYGTLLGAVREGKVLGHDSDADLGYVSRYSNPVDVARESFEVQRRLARDGWEISRYSGASFKIYVTEADVRRGLDVFGGFLDAGRLYLMGEIGTPFEREWIHPLGTAELEGRAVPVPARPEKLLEATYGPGWRTPDPAFKFTTPERTIRAFDDWFRGVQPGLRHWDRKAAQASARSAVKKPSLLAKRAAKLARRLDAEILDVGAGSGTDSLWLARQGHTVTAYDFAVRGLAPAREHAAREDLPLDVRYLNLADRRSVLSEGARLASRPRPRVVLARHVVDATSGLGRESLARLCSMALRDGGQLLAEFYTGTDARLPDWVLGTVDTDAFATLLRGAGAAQVDVQELERKGRPIVRVVGEWS